MSLEEHGQFVHQRQDHWSWSVSRDRVNRIVNRLKGQKQKRKPNGRKPAEKPKSHAAELLASLGG